MTRIAGYVAGALGAFLLTLALLLQFYGAGALMKTPTDVDSTTLLTGTAELSGEVLEVAATSITKADSEKSDDDIVFFESSSCLVQVIDGERGCVSAEAESGALLSAGTTAFASDRKTAMGISEGRAVDDLGAEPREGLINKWPFDAEQTSYPVWDDTVGDAVETEFDRVETVAGVEAYVYRQVVEDFPATITGGGQGTYSVDKQIFVEPKTGSIINQIEHREHHATDGTPVLILDLEFTEEQKETSAGDADGSRSALALVTGTIPVVGYILGPILLLTAAGLLLLSRRRSES